MQINVGKINLMTVHKLTHLCFFFFSPLSWPPSDSHNRNRPLGFLQPRQPHWDLCHTHRSTTCMLGNLFLLQSPDSYWDAHPCSSTLCLSVCLSLSYLTSLEVPSPCLGLPVLDNLFTCWSLTEFMPKMWAEYASLTTMSDVSEPQGTSSSP